MKLLYLTIIFCLLALGSYSQIRIIDKPLKTISSLHAKTTYEIWAEEIEDGKIKITFFADTTFSNSNYGQIYLNSYEDFDSLYQIIKNGFKEKKDHLVFVDLDNNSKLILRFSHYQFLIKSSSVTITHSYDTSLYQTKTTKSLREKDINKLFQKD